LAKFQVNFSKENVPFLIMTQKLKTLSEQLSEIGFEHTFLNTITSMLI